MGNILIILDFLHRVLNIWLSVSVDSLVLQRLSAAMTNAVFILSRHDDDDESARDGEPEKLLIRIYGEGIESILNREEELIWFAKMSDARAGPQLLATFENGRIEEYIESVTLTPEMMRNPDSSDEIARTLAKFHSLSVSDDSHGSVLWSRLENWKEEAQKSFHLLMKRLQQSQFNHHKMALLERIDAFNIFHERPDCQLDALGSGFFEHLKSLNSPLVPCHNDLQHGNILLSLENEDIVFIDYEYGGMNYAAYDIANHFCEWASDFSEANPNPHIMDFFAQYPSRESQTRFIQAYLGGKASEEVINRWIYSIEEFKEISHLLWAYWGIVQAGVSSIDFDYLGYSLMRLEAMRKL